MKRYALKLTKEECKALDKILKWAYEQARDMRGMYTGHPDPSVPYQYNLRLKELRLFRRIVKLSI